jgi:chromosome segregation ATPase
MENPTTDFERIEEELQELRKRFFKADAVLRDLEEIQIQFEGLVETHRELKEYVTKVSQFNAQSEKVLVSIEQARKSFEKNLTELKEKNTLQLDSINSQLSDFHPRINTCDSKIQAFESSISVLEQALSTSQHQLSLISTDLNLFREQVVSKQSRIEEHLTQLERINQKQHNDVNSTIEGLQTIKKQLKTIRSRNIILFALNLFLLILILLK